MKYITEDTKFGFSIKTFLPFVLAAISGLLGFMIKGDGIGSSEISASQVAKIKSEIIETAIKPLERQMYELRLEVKEDSREQMRLLLEINRRVK